MSEYTLQEAAGYKLGGIPPGKEHKESTITIKQSDAYYLAQFLKRITWTEYMSCSGDENEAHQHKSAVSSTLHALKELGIDPR